MFLLSTVRATFVEEISLVSFSTLHTMLPVSALFRAIIEEEKAIKYVHYYNNTSRCPIS